MFSANSSQVSDDKLFVEDVFSTYLYTGNGTTQTITNGIDLAGKGGMVWVKSRSAATDNFLFDTTRGVNVEINSNSTDANATLANSVTAFNSNGFAISSAAGIGVNAATYASWTFREAPKFFDVVTYTGTGATRTIAHNLGVAPGCIIVKRTDTTGAWQVYHRSNANTEYMVLNTTAGKATGTTRWNSTTPTASEFTVGTDATVNANGGTYVAYLFAHDATSDGIIQCGSYTGNGSATGPVINLGWEPQWLLIKRANGSISGWQLLDNMRGLPVGSADATLQANLTSAESAIEYVSPTATGFQITSTATEVNNNGDTYVYIAIRRGPMRTPTVGTSVFKPVTYTGDGTNSKNFTGVGFPADLILNNDRARDNTRPWFDRLRGGALALTSVSASEEGAVDYGVKTFTMDGYIGGTGDGNTFAFNANGITYANYNFRRAPGFFDVVCYTGTGTARTVNHNLGVAPELTIFKSRIGAAGWYVLYDANASDAKYANLNTTAAGATATYGAGNAWSGQPTATTLSLGSFSDLNGSGSTYVAYLFASCAGVSKVGSYTGNGSSQTINCAFTTGARFVLIKRTNTSGSWFVWDTARGIVAGNDPYLALNTGTAEVTSNDTIDTASSGFVVNQVAATNVNVNAATYIYLAIA